MQMCWSSFFDHLLWKIPKKSKNEEKKCTKFWQDFFLSNLLESFAELGFQSFTKKHKRPSIGLPSRLQLKGSIFCQGAVR
jgi:hypothetical protein